VPFLRDTPLVTTVEHVVQLTGRTDLRNLESSGELDLQDLLRSTSNTVHDKLQARGVVPAEVQNEHVYENAVAWQFLGVLAEAGSLGNEDPEALFARSDRYFEDVQPRLLPGAATPSAAGLPAVRNVTTPPFRSSHGGRA